MNVSLTSHIILLLARPPCHSIWCTVPISLEGSSGKQVRAVKCFILKAYLLFLSSFWIWTSRYLSFCVCFSFVSLSCLRKPFLLLSNMKQQSFPDCSRGGTSVPQYWWPQGKGTWLGTNMVQEVSYPKGSHWRDCVYLHPASSPSSRLQWVRKDRVGSRRHGRMLLITGGRGCFLGRTGRGKERNMGRLLWGSITNPLTKRRE